MVFASQGIFRCPLVNNKHHHYCSKQTAIPARPHLSIDDNHDRFVLQNLSLIGSRHLHFRTVPRTILRSRVHFTTQSQGSPSLRWPGRRGGALFRNAKDPYGHYWFATGPNGRLRIELGTMRRRRSFRHDRRYASGASCMHAPKQASCTSAQWSAYMWVSCTAPLAPHVKVSRRGAGWRSYGNW
mgnify:CR=1 FL=1